MKDKIFRFARLLDCNIPGWLSLVLGFVYFLVGMYIAVVNYDSPAFANPAFYVGLFLGLGWLFLLDGIFAFFDKKSKKKSES